SYRGDGRGSGGIAFGREPGQGRELPRNGDGREDDQGPGEAPAGPHGLGAEVLADEDHENDAGELEADGPPEPELLDDPVGDAVELAPVEGTGIAENGFRDPGETGRPQDLVGQHDVQRGEEHEPDVIVWV